MEQSRTEFQDDGVMDDQLEKACQSDNESLKKQVKVDEDMIIAALVCYDDIHRIVDDFYRKAQMEKR